MIKFLDWSDEYETGIDAIDEDHQKLFKAVNDLHDSYAIKDGNTHFAELFDILSDYVDYHFAREEEVMRGMGYPQLESHIVSHRELAATVHEYAKIYRSDPQAISRKVILDFLGNWLSKHILGSDMDYVPYVKAKKVEPAAELEPPPPV